MIRRCLVCRERINPSAFIEVLDTANGIWRALCLLCSTDDPAIATTLAHIARQPSPVLHRRLRHAGDRR